MAAASGRFTEGSADRKADVECSPGRRYARLFFRSRYYQLISGLVVICDFVSICQDADATARMKSGDSSSAALVMNACFGYYAFDLCLRFYAEGCATLKCRSTWLDILVVVASLSESIVGLVQPDSEGGSSLVVRMLRLFRLLRLLRIAKLLAGMKELRLLLQMIGTCAKTMLWCFLMALLVTAMWAVVAVEVLHPVAQRLKDDAFNDCERCSRSFESVWAASLTFFQTVLAGDAWGEVCMPIIEEAPWTGVVFSGALFTLTYGLMQLSTAVVVDSFATTRQGDVNTLALELEADERDEKKWLRSVFEALDIDRSGEMSLEELIGGMRKSREFGQWLRVMDLDGDDLQRLFTMLDCNQSGIIEVAEFIDVLYRMKTAESRTTVKMVKHVVETMEQTLNRLATSVHSLHNRVETMQGQLPTASPSASPRRWAISPRHDDCSAALQEAEASLQTACSLALRAALSTASDRVYTLREEATSQKHSEGRLIGVAEEAGVGPHRSNELYEEWQPRCCYCLSPPCEQSDNTTRSRKEAQQRLEPSSPREWLHDSGEDFFSKARRSGNLAMYLQYPSGQPAAWQRQGSQRELCQGEEEAKLQEEEESQEEAQQEHTGGQETCQERDVRFAPGTTN
eukprot:TRINITY_DN25884_c1_g1_i2.p1 TRINITY_DN25884_c1_g1~~TRINITY_DN25884_c1_g1_i2.p1  ORF type:complete len:628 (-),score=100.02 TRINITY_DN25884_c1_g1_i2:463-2346(-)